eukprot:CAMPEP_0194038462 /NCGR_PEP_ID=MMETSP0009_2-20130614/10701_1 /TAXON_ID=210454 /ORGANISM="Grammatophora oceanica, Strain CCMP 410" /LENGTH=211 /DNA_ID=CAMNT_0038680975 /DNA_START=89 /DNA_END=724 /DNA_ORIENTATION=+
MVFSDETKRSILVVSNGITCLTWALVVLKVVAVPGYKAFANEGDPTACEESLSPAIQIALAASLLELLSSVTGITRTNPAMVALFTVARSVIELLIAPMIGCAAWQHVCLGLAWGIGDSVRFGCFTLGALFPDKPLIKSIRYSVGPIAFPIGVLFEILMLIRAASDGRPGMYIVALLWPAGFYPLMKQLLKQRRKHFASLAPKKKPEIKQI